ncbi:unnamed protein product [Trifolium pratense]|uniref:Uncharacterized protein n=1 Tax=Trifolium pratense TaxID=57577 RepID=A0ACB0LG39_TRIPR|nr:unnamed protein product [Trifolium pratense]
MSLWWRDLLKHGTTEEYISSVVSCGRTTNGYSIFHGFLGTEQLEVAIGLAGLMQQIEAAESDALAVLLADVKLVQARADRRKWVPESSGHQFTVRSTYSFLQNMDVTNVIDTNVVCALKKLWLNDVPSKVGMFGWRLLLAKLPTRASLASRGIITNHHETCCAFCFREVEDLNHVFFQCRFSEQVWRKICCWMQVAHFNFEGWLHQNLIKS